jgi:hypothetical protein
MLKRVFLKIESESTNKKYENSKNFNRKSLGCPLATKLTYKKRSGGVLTS